MISRRNKLINKSKIILWNIAYIYKYPIRGVVTRPTGAKSPGLC